MLLDTDGAEDLPEDLHENPRYRCIEPMESRQAFRTMENFLDSVADSQVADRLALALRGPKPFRRFKDVLLDFPEWRAAWFSFERGANAECAVA